MNGPILGIDTSAKVASVALVEGGKILYTATLEAGLTHSETVLPMIEQALKVTHHTVSDIALYAVSNGPGSFTGIRIGIATVKGLAFRSGVPCVGVSTLEALACNLLPSSENCIVCPVMDARRHQFYNALFRLENGVLTRLCEDRLIVLEDLKAELSRFELPILAVGDGYELLHAGVDFLADTPALLRAQSGVSIALLAERIYDSAADKQSFSDKLLLPVYLRASQAERELAEKENASHPQ